MFSFFVVFFRVVCWGLCPSACFCFGLLCLSLCVGCCLACVRSFGVLCGVAGSCWPLFAVVFSSSVALLVFALLCGVASVWPVLSWLRPPLSCPPPRLVLWCLLVQSVFCWSLPPGIWLYLQRPGCHACGMVCCDGLAPVFTSPHGNKGFGPVWGFCPLHHVAGVVQVPFFPALRYSPLGDPEPPQDTVRAACAHLLGLCCFLPPVLAAFPGALSLLLLLASACCLPPRPCSHFGFHCPLRCLCVFLCVVCCPFLAFCVLFGLFLCGVFGPLFRLCCCFLCCAWCQLTEVTKDCRGAPAPTSHTHTPATVTSSLPSRICWRLVCP